MSKNRLREYRIKMLISKSELAKKSGLSIVTIDRIEKGYDCRIGTKRKILEALGLSVQDKDLIFPDEDYEEEELVKSEVKSSSKKSKRG